MNKPQSENKTIEQIRDNGSKRHCWPREQISDVYEYGYIAGFDAALALSEKRAAGLVEALNKITIQATSKEYLEECNDELDGITAIEALDSLIIEAREALSKYRSEG